MINNATSFWKFIQKHPVEIPIIQRDYAQGRLGKEYIRRDFLANQKKALDDYLKDDTSVLKLDFVYGTEHNGKLYPLDGQQRLTTLWLLHWYIALKIQKLGEVGDTLTRFSYETRVSSREFCKELCTAANFEGYDGSTSIVDFIMSRTWFYSLWKQDPTIQSMLRMIGGTKINDKSGEDIIDGLEELFQDTDNETFAGYWEVLTSDNAPIVFYYLPLKDFGLTDDLYIKMNARGKQLTAFENFKADLVGYIEEQAQTTKGPKWEELRENIPLKMDTEWIDLFWNSEISRVDEAYYAFLNRFFWNELFTTKDSDNKYILKTGKGELANGQGTSSIENHNSSYAYLNKDNYDVYTGLEPYKYLEVTLSEGAAKEIPAQFFDDLRKVLDNYKEYKQEKSEKGNVIPVAKWVDGFEFIPRYDSSKEAIKITGLTQRQRIAFFAVYKYLKEGKADELSLRRWMRVVWNLISGEDESGNPQIRDASTVRTAIELLDRLDSHDVYRSLCQQDIEENSSLSKQYKEEINKALQIIHVDGSLRKYEGELVKEDSTLYATWEEVIIEAENYAFFKGSIRFLFRDGNGNINWSLFDEKLKNAQAYFKKDFDPKGSAMNDNYRNANLLKALISKFTGKNFYDVLWWWHRTFNNRPASWMYYLLNDNIREPIHQLLRGENDIIQRLPSENIAENILYQLSNTKLLDFIREKMPYAWIRNIHGHTAIYPSSTGIFLDAQKRDDFLLHTSGISIADNYKVPGTKFLYSWHINFTYCCQNFQWYGNDFIYLMKENDPNEYQIKDESKKDEIGRYYCFNTKLFEKEQIIGKLDELICQCK